MSDPVDDGDLPLMELSIPIEFIVEGVPLSLQASSNSRNVWKQKVLDAALGRGEGGEWAIQRPLYITILYFPDSPMIGDIDNIVKPILDAMCPNIYMDDGQVERVIVQKFEPDRSVVFDNPSPILAEAIGYDRPVTYIRIDDEGSEKGMPL